MRYILICFFFLNILSNYSFSQDTITVYYDSEWNEISNKTNAVYYRKAFQDSTLTWVVLDYYLSNKIQMTGSFKSKKLNTKEGHFVYYYENGQKQSEGEYMNDKRTGMWNFWHENGQKKSEGKWEDDKREEKWNYWHENGRKKCEGKYENDKREGEWIYYSEQGKLSNKEFFDRGSISSGEGYFVNGNKYFSGNYLNGKQHGIWTYWNPDEKVAFKGNFKNGVRDGEWVRYFRDDEMKIIYKNGVIQNKIPGGIVRRN